MQRRYCYVSGIRLGVPALEELCAQGRPPSLVISYPAEYADSSGFNHFEDLARTHNLPHVRACDTNSEEARQALATHAIDLMVVAGWSQQVHEQALDDLPLGGVALHPTPLPVGRGHAPIPWTILRGMHASAVTLHHLTTEAGAGDIIDQTWFDLPEDITATGLYERVAHLQSELLIRHIDDLLAGTAPRRPQTGHPSVWPQRRPSDGRIDLTASGTDVDRMVRALADPYPGAFAMFGNTRITLCSGKLTDTTGNAPGEIVSAGPGRTWGITCGDRRVFVPDVIRVDEGVRADPTSLAMFRPGEFFDEPTPHTIATTRHAHIPGQTENSSTLLRA